MKVLIKLFCRGDIPLLDVPFSNMSMTWRWADRAFNSSIPTKVIVHGFGSNCDHVWVYEMRSALMAVVSYFFIYILYRLYNLIDSIL